MKIHSLMIHDPITIMEKTTIEDALTLMKQNSIRHLPVVTESGNLKGLVTLSDIKQSLIPSMLGDISLSDIMVRKPIKVNPDADIETAALLIYKHKISGIPVVSNRKLVGIITESDILRAFVHMMGILSNSSRIDVEISNEPGSLRNAVQIINEAGGDIINVGMTEEKNKKRAYYFRLSACRTSKIKKALEKQGYRVMDAMD
ncbi:MAG: CBS and ACT domain-containing protein [Desulfobacterales bacterium]